MFRVHCDPFFFKAIHLEHCVSDIIQTAFYFSLRIYSVGRFCDHRGIAYIDSSTRGVVSGAFVPSFYTVFHQCRLCYVGYIREFENKKKQKNKKKIKKKKKNKKKPEKAKTNGKKTTKKPEKVKQKQKKTKQKKNEKIDVKEQE